MYCSRVLPLLLALLVTYSHLSEGKPRGLKNKQAKDTEFIYKSTGPNSKKKGKFPVKCRVKASTLQNFATSQERYNYYKRQLTNCSTVVGNLVLEGLDGHMDYDLSFLSSIRVITGYLKIYRVYSTRIPLMQLSRIKGKHLLPVSYASDHYPLYPDEYQTSLYVSETTMNENTGLKYLLLPKLKRIGRGDVVLGRGNLRLCFPTESNWKLMVIEKEAQIKVHSSSGYPWAFYLTCEPCHSSCMNQCWGPGKENCIHKKFRKGTPIR